MRKKDREWNCGGEGGTTHEEARLAVLMDIRDELKRLNSLLHCQNFLGMPRVLKRIDSRLAKRIKLK